MSDSPVVLVTGGARRIGAQISKQFHLRGFKVIIHYNSSADEANQLVESLNVIRPDSASLLQASLTDQDEVQHLARQSLEQFGRVDVLINNASSFYPTPVEQVSQENWDDLMGSNLRAAFFLSCTLAPELAERQGAIVNIVDAMVDRSLPDHPIYSIAKAGLKSMTKSLALELAPTVRVNAVSPGAILWPASLENGDDPEVQNSRKRVLDGIPLGRLGNPDDIAQTVYFLAREASYMTGAIVKVDGGRALG